MSDSEDDLYTVGKAAKYLGVSRQRVYELLLAERFGKRIGGVWFVPKEQLDAYKIERDSKELPATPSPVALAA